MIYLFQQGNYQLVVMLIIALILSLSIHEFGHAAVAKMQGDDTAQRAGRLTINPIAHIDLMGLLMVILIGIGYAKPVPTNPANFTSRYSDLWIAAAGPFMNLVLAAIVWNGFLLYQASGGVSDAVYVFASLLASINMLLMLFNLIPLGPLDGHYILPYFLPRELSRRYVQFNARHGTIVFLALIVLSFMGLPLLQWLSQLSQWMLVLITVV